MLIFMLKILMKNQWNFEVKSTTINEGIGEFTLQSILQIVIGVGLMQNVETVTYVRIVKGKPHRKIGSSRL